MLERNLTEASGALYGGEKRFTRLGTLYRNETFSEDSKYGFLYSKSKTT